MQSFSSSAAFSALVLQRGRGRSPRHRRAARDGRHQGAVVGRLRGRAPASEGEKKTVAYLIQQMKAAGLQPAGDRQADGGRAWTQDVPLVRSATKGPVSVSVKLGG